MINALLASLLAGWGGTTGIPQLEGPWVTKLDWDTRSLVSADIDDNGRNDLVLINNERARIELLYAESPKAGATWDDLFRVEHLNTGVPMFALVAADFNSDGRCDLAYTPSSGGVVVRLQKRGGKWNDELLFDAPGVVGYASSLLATDINGDRRTDLAVITKQALLVFIQNASGQLDAPLRYGMGEGNYYSLMAMDLDGDQRQDLMYLMTESDYAIHVRFQYDHGLGPERHYACKSPYGVAHALRIASENRLAVVHGRNDVFEMYRFADQELDSYALWPQVYSTLNISGDTCYTVGDFDGNRLLDIACTSAEQPRMEVFFQESPGVLSSPLSFPAFVGVSHLASGDKDGDGMDEIYMTSPKEKALGVSRMLESGRMSYPTPIEMAGVPLAVAVVTAGEQQAIACVVNEDGLRKLAVNIAGEVHVQTIEGLKTNPKSLKVADVDGDGRDDLIVLAVQEPARFFLQGEGVFAPMDETKGFQRGLVNNLGPESLTSADFDGDGRREMWVASDSFARVLAFDPDREIRVVDQVNSRNDALKVDSAVSMDVDGDGQAEVVLVDGRKGTLQVQKRNRRGVFEYDREFKSSRIDLVDVVSCDMDGNGQEDLLLFGKKRFWWVTSGHRDRILEDAGTVESELEDFTLTTMAVGDLNRDGLDDVVLCDSVDSRIVQVMLQTAKGSFEPALHFKVFEADPHYRGKSGAKSEPREMLIEDVTGDGANDLVILVHDRVLVYRSGS